MRPFLLAVSCLLLVAGCGESRAPGAASERPPDDPLITCGGASFRASALSDGVAGLADPGEVEEALLALREEGGIDASPALQGDGPIEGAWFVLGGSADELVVATGSWDASGPREGAMTVGLERVGDGWRTSGWGGCRLEPVVAHGSQWVELTAPAGGLDRAATTITVLVNERQCTSGRDPEPFLEEPTVVEDDIHVTVSWTAEAMTGDADCQGNPPVPAELTLSEPLGDRELLDGSVYPAAPVTDPTGR